jgi:hypothetical protein
MTANRRESPFHSLLGADPNPRKCLLAQGTWRQERQKEAENPANCCKGVYHSEKKARRNSLLRRAL